MAHDAATPASRTRTGPSPARWRTTPRNSTRSCRRSWLKRPRRAPPTSSSSSSTTSGSARRAPSAVRSTDADRPAAGRRAASTPSSTPPRSARPRGPRCCTGRNHHQRRHGRITGRATRVARLHSSIRPTSATPLPRCCASNGYNTAQFGKCHEVPVWEVRPAGPFDHWPNASRVRAVLRFHGGETDQWTGPGRRAPPPIEPPDDPDYHLMADLADKAIDWIRQQKAIAPDKPFFTYFARGDAHPAPGAAGVGRQVQGQVRPGLGQLREETFARQKAARRHPRRRGADARAGRIRPGTDIADAIERRCPGRWRSTPASWNTPTPRSGRVIDALSELGTSTTR